MWEAKKWLIHGCRWRIGDGKKAKIWKDCWTPRHKALCVELSGSSAEQCEETVDTLINEDTKGWKVDRIRALFNPNIATKVLKIVIFPVTILINGYGTVKGMVDSL